MRRVQRPDPAALEELVGGCEDRRRLPQLATEPEREIERPIPLTHPHRRRRLAGVARPRRARRRAREEVAVARQVVVLRRRSWAARRARRHHWHHHLHL